VRRSKLDQQPSEVPQPVPLVGCIVRLVRLAHETQLEPEPVLRRLRDTGDVATVDLEAADELVEGLLVRVGRPVDVADTLVELGEEPVPQELGETVPKLASARIRGRGREGRTDGRDCRAMP
jgi:hypothetical protein